MTTGFVIWITGYSGAGKTAVAEALQQRFVAAGLRPILLDGDVLRGVFGATNDRFDAASRRGLAFVYARLCQTLATQGFIVICATISMVHDVRAWNRAHQPGYCEVYLKVPLEVRTARDAKGHYARADEGGTPMVGIDGTADEPMSSDITIENWGQMSADDAAGQIWEWLERGITGGRESTAAR